MDTPNPLATPSLGRALRALVKGDRLTQLALAAGTVLTAFLLLPAVSIELKKLAASWLALPFLTLTLITFLHRRGEITETGERRFWDYLGAGFGSLWVVAVLYKMPPLEGFPAALVSFGANLAVAIYYFFFVLAGEHEPGRPNRPASDRFETLLTWPAAGVFVLGFLVYFTLLPPFDTGVSQSAPLQTVHFFLALDTYLFVRFGVLARLSGSPRWRLLYGAWAVAFAGTLIDDLLRLLTSAHPDHLGLALFRYVFWLSTFLLAIVAIRLRHALTGPRVSVRSAAPFENARLPAAGSRTLVFALGFPAVHILFHQLELLDPAYEPPRRIVAFGWMLLLGLVALAQTRLLDQRAAEIWGERRRFQAQLASSEDDLRLILERRRAERSLRVAEDRFERIFRACPDAIVITSEQDGLVVDANPGFERVTGFARAEMLGRTLAEIGIRSLPDDRAELIRKLDQRGATLETEVNFRDRWGHVRIARLLLDRVMIAGERCLITLARDVTARRKAEVEREKQAALLDNAAAAIYALDCEGRVSFWNRGAERLFGRDASAALGHAAGDLATLTRPEAPAAIDLWSSAILDEQGLPAGRLVVASEAKFS